MHTFKKKLFICLTMFTLIFSMLGGSLIPPSIEVQAMGVAMSPSSTLNLSTVTTDYRVPQSMKEIKGDIDHLRHSIKKIYPTAKGSKLYWGENLPFDLVDKATGKVYPGYCAQSYAWASTNMTAKGVVTDSRILKLIESATAGSDVENPTDAQQIAIQIVLWGALNNDWSPNLFSGGHIALDEDAYDGMRSVATHVNRIASQWGQIIGGDDKTIKSIKPSRKEVTAQCSDSKDGTALAEVDWKHIDGGKIKDLKHVAESIKYDGFSTVYNGSNPAHHAKIKEYGFKPKATADYLFVKDATKADEVKVKVTVKYNTKTNYRPLNNVALIQYSGGSSNQPFILPRVGVGNTTFDLTVNWDCKPQPPPPPPPPGESNPSCGKAEATSTEVRWFNMPSAFGEMKDGVGFNNDGHTTAGTYATARSSEEFEAMNGVPSTERFYVNLGGTEGFMDVTYSFEELNQEFTVDWDTPWVIPKTCEDDEGESYDCSESGVNSFNKSLPWEFKAMHIKEATFRVFGDGAVSQPDLELDLQIVNSKKDVGSYELMPNPAGLEVGPGVGDSTYNIGATSAWDPCQGVFTTATVVGRQSVESDGKQEAYGQANGNVGQIFAQNDALKITIQGTTYEFVPEVNKKSDVAYKDGGGSLDATDGKNEAYFNPVGEKWDVWGHVPIAGYNGNPEDDTQRSLKGTPILLENLPINILKGNGIYPFEDSEAGNKLDYDAIVTTIKGGTKDLHSNVAELKDGSAEGTGTVYGSSEDPVNEEYYIDGNFALLQYTNWQVPVSAPSPNPNNLNFKHSKNEPDGTADETLSDNPRYRSVNPVLIHNPTTSLYSWISDIPYEQLADQRIDATNEKISKHDRATSDADNPRQYVDYDFQLTIPNIAAFNKYWSQTAKNSLESGFEDLDFTSPGTLGKKYEHSAMRQVQDRSYTNPYLGANGWNVSKWMTAKYVKFPYDVYYYKNADDAGRGGDIAGFYDAGTWIKLYDDNNMVQAGDPTIFNFHVTSDQKDVKDGIVYIASETLNSQGALQGNAEALYNSGEQYVNGTRSVDATTLGDYTTVRDGEATYSAVNQINVDAIGRIGNLVVSDTTDPAWSDVFWEVKDGKIQTNKPVSKNYGLYYNIYESNAIPNKTGFPIYNRFKTLNEWMNEETPIHSLPLTTNVLTKGKEKQPIKLGYSVGGSIQTIGDYDYSMWIYPQNQLAGKYNTGNAGQHFKLMSSDPFVSGAKFKEYYDSNVNNTLHGVKGLLGKDYSAPYQHKLSGSLADPRMKISNWEKGSATYQKAVQKGPTDKTLIGSPSWVVVPNAMRTLMGRDESQGRWGLGSENGNNPLGAKDQASSADCKCSFENAQKWNWNYSLPQNTQVWFDKNPQNINKSGIPKFEKPTKNQYIITSMAYRTKTNRVTFPGEGDAWQENIKLPAIQYGDHYMVKLSQSIPDWDLTMYTNTGQNTLPDILGNTRDVPEGITPSTDPKVPYTYDPTQEGDIGAPMIDIVWWNYSKPASTDKDNIGTH